jgi:hypothetical protein
MNFNDLIGYIEKGIRRSAFESDKNFNDAASSIFNRAGNKYIFPYEFR